MLAKLLNKLDFIEIARGSAFALIFRVLGSGMGFLHILVITRLLGIKSLGLFGLFFALLQVISVVCRYGVDVSVLKLLGKHSSELGGKGIQYAVMGSAAVVGLYASLLATVIWFIADWVHFPKLGMSESVIILKALAINLPFFSVYAVFREGIRGLKHAGFYAFLSNMIIPLLSTVVILATPHSLRKEYLPLASYFIALVISLAYAIIWLYSACKNREQVSTDWYRDHVPKGKVRWGSMPFFFTSVFAMALQWADTIILGNYGSASDIGAYSVAIRVAAFSNMCLLAVNVILAPKLARATQENHSRELESMMNYGSILSCVATVLSVCVLMIASQRLLHIFRIDLETAYSTLMLLLLGQLFNGFSGPVEAIMKMTGLENQFWRILLLACIVNLVLSFLLIPKMGILGAAVSNVSAMLLWNYLCLLEVRSSYGFVFIAGKKWRKLQ